MGRYLCTGTGEDEIFEGLVTLRGVLAGILVVEDEEADEEHLIDPDAEGS